jgi:hypothetical protein
MEWQAPKAAIVAIKDKRRAAAALLRYLMLGPLECCHLHWAKVETAVSLSSFFTLTGQVLPRLFGPYKSLADTRCQSTRLISSLSLAVCNPLR